MTREQVVAVPRLHHGLGNRMRLVLSAQDLAESSGRDFAYVWPTGKAFGARLDDLWDVDMRRISRPTSRALSLRYPYRDGSEEWRGAAAGERIWQVRSSQPVVVSGRIDTWHDRLRRLRPSTRVNARICAQFDTGLQGVPYLGVMVRSHVVSHENTLAASPLEWYLDRISDVRRRNPELPIYVSADTVRAFDVVASAFPGVHGQRDKGAYNSRSALAAAVADLYLLASATHILGPHYSSFPELSEYLAGGSVALETSMSSPESSFDESAPRTIVKDPTRPAVRFTV